MTLTVFTTRSVGNTMSILCAMFSKTENSKDIGDLIGFCADNDIVLNSPQFTVFTDRGSALLKTVRLHLKEVFPMLCSLHLKRNITDKYGLKVEPLFQNAAYAKTKNEYDVAMAALKVKHEKAYDELSSISEN